MPIENTPTQNISPKMYWALGVCVLVALLIGAFFFYQIRAFKPDSTDLGTSATSTIGLDAQIKEAYDNMNRLNFTNNDPYLDMSLKTFRDIASNPSNPVLERVQALNGINFAYVASNFNAVALYNNIFSQLPFSQYYTASTSTAPDPAHPNIQGDTEGVDAAIVKLNEYSNALMPNHYAIARMEVAQLFEYSRAASKGGAATTSLQQEYAAKLKQLIAAYDALPSIESAGYDTALMMQLMYLHANAQAFVGGVLNDAAYLDKGEALYTHVIDLGENLLKSQPNNRWIKNQVEFARMFYASSYWLKYKASNPEKIRAVLRDLASDYDGTIPLYSQYLPTHADGTVQPATTLRDVAQQVPELKALLVKVGWKF
jgi:hypothetical protein